MNSTNKALSLEERTLLQQVKKFAELTIIDYSQAELLTIVGDMTDFIQSDALLQTAFVNVQLRSQNELSALTLADLQTLAANMQKLFAELLEQQSLLVNINAAPSTNLVSELNNVDFAKIVGGPMQGAIQAQTASSLASIDFIQEVGFEKDEDGNLTGIRYVDFMYDEKTGEFDEEGNEKLISKKIKVPLLSMVTVPSLRIESLDINFNVKLNSIESQDISSKFKVGGSLKVGWGPVSLKVSSSYQRSSSTGVKVEKQYNMNVQVKATQDEIPLGLEKILNMLAN